MNEKVTTLSEALESGWYDQQDGYPMASLAAAKLEGRILRLEQVAHWHLRDGTTMKEGTAMKGPSAPPSGADVGKGAGEERWCACHGSYGYDGPHATCADCGLPHIEFRIANHKPASAAAGEEKKCETCGWVRADHTSNMIRHPFKPAPAPAPLKEKEKPLPTAEEAANFWCGMFQQQADDLKQISDLVLRLLGDLDPTVWRMNATAIELLRILEPPEGEA